MPKNQVSDLVTDQEITFAHLVLSGTMTDRQAAEAVGLNPDTAAYTKAKPRVRAYMLEHRAAMHDRLVQQESEEQRRLNLGRERVLARLWEIADLDPDMTRNSMSAQIKALSMIVAIEGLIPVGIRIVAPAPPRTNPPLHLFTRKSIPPPGFASNRGKPPALSLAPTLPETKMCLAFPIPRPARRQTRLRILALPPAQTLTPANPSSPAPLAPRKRPRRRLMPPCPLLLQTTGSLPLWKRNPPPGA
jgi:hypothetical protein